MINQLVHNIFIYTESFQSFYTTDYSYLPLGCITTVQVQAWYVALSQLRVVLEDCKALTTCCSAKKQYKVAP